MCAIALLIGDLALEVTLDQVLDALRQSDLAEEVLQELLHEGDGDVWLGTLHAVVELARTGRERPRLAARGPF